MSFEGVGTAYAAATDATYQVVDGPWYIHDPNSPPGISSTTIGLGYTGDTLTISCHETSDTVSGDAEWDLVTDQHNGLTGYMADLWYEYTRGSSGWNCTGTRGCTINGVGYTGVREQQSGEYADTSTATACES
jgi:hypothetical protein